MNCEIHGCESEAEFYDYMDDKVCDGHRLQMMSEDNELEDEDFEPIEQGES